MCDILRLWGYHDRSVYSQRGKGIIVSKALSCERSITRSASTVSASGKARGAISHSWRGGHASWAAVVALLLPSLALGGRPRFRGALIDGAGNGALAQPATLCVCPAEGCAGVVPVSAGGLGVVRAAAQRLLSQRHPLRRRRGVSIARASPCRGYMPRKRGGVARGNDLCADKYYW